MAKFQKGHSKRGGRQKGTQNKSTCEAKEIFESIVHDEEYLANLKARMVSGKVHPGVEKMAWEYVHGKAPDKVEVSGPDGKELKQGADIRFDITEVASALERIRSGRDADSDSPSESVDPSRAHK